MGNRLINIRFNTDPSVYNSFVRKSCKFVYTPHDCFNIAYNEDDRIITGAGSAWNENDDVHDACHVYGDA